MNLGHNKIKVRTEIWVKPGEHQTLEDILERFAGSILQVEGDEVLIAVKEESQEVPAG